jgi:hypothetical protein
MVIGLVVLLRTTGRSDWLITIVGVHRGLISSIPPQLSVYVQML